MDNREIYDQQIAPLMEQIDAIAMEHGFAYIAVFQYSKMGVVLSGALKASSNKSMHKAWETLNEAVVWENEA